ncbi:MAG: glutathione S-transferase family protein [Pseudomonadota bacterium]
MKLYSFTTPTFNVTKPLLTAEELELDFTLVKLDPRAAEHKAGEHVARHPLGKVPALEHGDRVLFESMAITRYLLSLKPHTFDGDDAATSDQWSEFMILHPGRAIGVLFWEEIIRGKMNGLAPDAKAVAKATTQLADELGLVEERLDGRPWISGQAFGVADIVAASYLWSLEGLSFSLAELPRLKDWYARVTGRPAFARLRAHYA